MYSLSSANKGAALPKFLLGFLLTLGLSLSQAFSHPTAHAAPDDVNDIAWQSFEASPPANAWGYIANPTPYNTEGDPTVNGDEDIWAIIEEFTGEIDIPSDSDQFWGMQDLDNPNGGGNFDHTITFDTIDVSAYGALVITFDYNVFQFDNGDDLEYEVTLDGAPQGRVLLFEGAGNASTSGWETETVNVPASANSVSLQLIADQNGADDFAGWDNVRLFVDTPPTVDSTDPADLATKVPLDASITVTFSEEVNVTGSWFNISCPNSGVHTATVAGSSPRTTFILDPDTDFSNNETCTVTILSSQVTDVDDTADNMTTDYSWSFTTVPVTACEDITLNEINYDDPGDDDEEYVEIYSPSAEGGSSISLNDLELRFFNTATDSEYLTIDLNGVAMPADGYFVAGDSGVSNVDLSTDFSTGSDIQNDAEALGLYDANVGFWCWRYAYENGADYVHPTEGTFPVIPGDDEDSPTAGQSLSRRQATAPIGDFAQLAGYTPGGPNETPTAVTLQSLTAANGTPILLPLAAGLLLLLTAAWRRR